jgi:uncharacterized protein YmfQ (DUF2313 family)
MARTSGEVLAGISGNLLPTGWAWDHTPTSNTVRSLRPLADFASGFEAAAEAQLEEATPFTAQQLLGAYERVLGPDECLGDPATLTAAELRQSVNARWTLPTDVSIGGIIALAAAYGITITITEIRRHCCGVLRCGMKLCPNPQQFCWIVGLPQARVTRFTCGASKCGDPLGKVDRNTQIECIIRRIAPSHTWPVFQYGALPAGPGIAVWDEFAWGDGSVWGGPGSAIWGAFDWNDGSNWG